MIIFAAKKLLRPKSKYGCM